MSNDTYVSFYLSASKIHVYKKAITEIGNPRFVRFLMKEDGQSMIMESYHKKRGSRRKKWRAWAWARPAP